MHGQVRRPELRTEGLVRIGLMLMLRFMAAIVLGWIIARWVAGKLRGNGSSASGTRRAREQPRYRDLTDQPIDDAEYEDISRK